MRIILLHFLYILIHFLVYYVAFLLPFCYFYLYFVTFLSYFVYLLVHLLVLFFVLSLCPLYFTYIVCPRFASDFESERVTFTDKSRGDYYLNLAEMAEDAGHIPLAQALMKLKALSTQLL